MTDADGFNAVADLLSQLHIFEAVAVGRIRPRWIGGSSHLPLCWVQPLRWTEQDTDAYRVESPDRVRRVWFAVNIESRGGGDELEDLDLLAHLERQVCEAMAEAALGESLPAVTSIESGEWREGAPEASIRLIGSFTYLPPAG